MARLSSNAPRRKAAWCAILCAEIALGSVGCANQIYSPSRLPTEFIARSTANETANLSQLSHIAASNELVDLGDVLEVTIATDSSELPSTTTPVRVGEDGIARIPVVGPVPVAGLPLPDAEQSIAAAAMQRGVFRSPHVTLSMKQRRRNQITVIGAVKQPGVYELARGNSSLLTALVQAGGLSEDAAAEVEIRRSIAPRGVPQPMQSAEPQVAEGPAAGKVQQASYQGAALGPPQIVHVSLASPAEQDSRAQSLNDGDVVVVAKQTPKPVCVMGLVQKPGQFRIPPSQDLYVLDALALAGGRTVELADKVLIRRQAPGRDEPVVIEVSVRKAKHNAADNVRLAEGDIVSVEQTPVTVIAETLRSFVRVAVGGSVALF